METALYTGLGLCAVAGLRCAGTAIRWIGDRRRERREFLASLAAFEEELARSQQPRPRSTAAWKGYRRFVVQRVVAEADDISSIYLTPEDRRTLPGFLPGQFLTLRVQVPGQNQPAVRCYSLSDRPRRDHYRITVKAVRCGSGPPSGKGKVSRYLQRGLKPGDVLEVQAPRGGFYLREDSRPAVLIAAGIGITPLLSMAATLLEQEGQRKVILFYGVRNSREHAFRERLTEWAADRPQLQYLPCYSQPLPEDRLQTNVALSRRIDLALVRQTLPKPDFPCYLCGPGKFMADMIAGLREWGVAECDLHYEAFGPSTVKPASAVPEAHAATATSNVRFEQSGVSTAWDGKSASLLELAETQGLNLPSGCRSGNCGICSTRLLAGQVRYPERPTAPIDPGFCLTCVARPDSPELVIDA
jgi:ferredoxin-NADP reductase